MVPNLYTVLANSENALETYLNLENAPTSLSGKEVEVVNLVVSEINSCVYCTSAHTVIAKGTGFSDSDIIAYRSGNKGSDAKLDVLAKVTRALTEQRGHIDESLLDEFFSSGYTNENLVDAIMLIGDRTISNILHAVSKVAVDFPLAVKLEKA
ncbi:carboxymuconolactone decarboxylase family protein [Mucilaginibacter sabulilitoris]|uniref:Carboxymuconolactone decarboxylase family protein n=1 Tax=Mucilaginibacter sabulilitoris TaxID=1173583 RepID=A0ABZ0TNK8_9SPHI|nr:carboxymuconolactone decarboxylase family protein [Mucilaginibacter sabulilitoris]WPU94739.1 carboxymuconolactone decarboxylase family protein [Mucilaginibacter sabulilitoris]